MSKKLILYTNQTVSILNNLNIKTGQQLRNKNYQLI